MRKVRAVFVEDPYEQTSYSGWVKIEERTWVLGPWKHITTLRPIMRKDECETREELYNRAITFAKNYENYGGIIYESSN